MTIDFLCRELVRTDAPEIREMITTSLDAMAAGGIHDQLGGGFARYSTDATWLVPHFEKMLYDNALLTRAYTHGYLVTGDVRYRSVVEDIVGYVLTDLADPAGGFYAAEDADSEGVEGKFYLWSPQEIGEVCGADADEVMRYYGVTATPNFVDPHTNVSGSILHVAIRNEPEPPEVGRHRPALLARRARRVRPSRDDKVLLGWNSLFLAAMAEAAAALDRDDWMLAARTERDVLARASCAAPTVVSVGHGVRRTSRTQKTTPHCSRRSSPSPSSTTSPGSPTRVSSPTICCTCSSIAKPAASSRPATTPNPSWYVRRTSSTTRRHPRTRWPPTACSD